MEKGSELKKFYHMICLPDILLYFKEHAIIPIKMRLVVMMKACFIK